MGTAREAGFSLRLPFESEECYGFADPFAHVMVSIHTLNVLPRLSRKSKAKMGQIGDPDSVKHNAKLSLFVPETPFQRSSKGIFLGLL
jgi:hypothetical protein